MSQLATGIVAPASVIVNDPDHCHADRIRHHDKDAVWRGVLQAVAARAHQHDLALNPRIDLPADPAPGSSADASPSRPMNAGMTIRTGAVTGIAGRCVESPRQKGRAFSSLSRPPRSQAPFPANPKPRARPAPPSCTVFLDRRVSAVMRSA